MNNLVLISDKVLIILAAVLATNIYQLNKLDGIVLLGTLVFFISIPYSYIKDLIFYNEIDETGEKIEGSEMTYSVAGEDDNIILDKVS